MAMLHYKAPLREEVLAPLDALAVMQMKLENFQMA